MSDATSRFSDRAADYVAARPGYPDALAELVEDGLGLRPRSVLADVGSGTGLSALPFLRRGHAVTCVEPNAAMREAAESALGAHPGFSSTHGTAEATGLDTDSVDAVLVGQAFHWLDVGAAARELGRIVRPGGGAAVFWNIRRKRGTPFLEGFEALLERYGTDYVRVRERTAAVRVAGDGPLRRFFGGPYRTRVLDNPQVLDGDALRRRLRSSSYVPAPGADGHDAMMAALDALFRRGARDGVVRLEHDLEVYWGPLRRGASSRAL